MPALAKVPQPANGSTGDELSVDEQSSLGVPRSLGRERDRVRRHAFRALRRIALAWNTFDRVHRQAAHAAHCVPPWFALPHPWIRANDFRYILPPDTFRQSHLSFSKNVMARFREWGDCRRVRDAPDSFLATAAGGRDMGLAASQAKAFESTCSWTRCAQGATTGEPLPAPHRPRPGREDEFRICSSC